MLLMVLVTLFLLAGTSFGEVENEQEEVVSASVEMGQEQQAADSPQGLTLLDWVIIALYAAGNLSRGRAVVQNKTNPSITVPTM